MSDKFKRFILWFVVPLVVIVTALFYVVFHSLLPGIGGAIGATLFIIFTYYTDPDARRNT
jgi:hypothetical protein